MDINLGTNFWITPQNKILYFDWNKFLHDDFSKKKFGFGTNKALELGYTRGYTVNDELVLEIPENKTIEEVLYVLPDKLKQFKKIRWENVNRNTDDYGFAIIDPDETMEEAVFRTKRRRSLVAMNYKKLIITSALIKLSYIVHENGEYCVKSHKGKNLGKYKTRKEAEERLRQVEYFRNKSTTH